MSLHSGINFRVAHEGKDGIVISVVTHDEGEPLDETVTAVAPCGTRLDEIDSLDSALAWLEFGPQPDDWAEMAQDAMEERASRGW